MNLPRTYLGRDQNLAGIIRVYLLPDSVEVDEISLVEIERTRVYFDDVLAVTYHRARSAVFLVLMGIIIGLIALPGVALVAKRETGVAVFFLILVSPCLLSFLLHLLLKTDYITIYGRRTMARMRFRVRKARAREVFQQLTARIRAAQATAAAAAAAAAPPPPAPELPPGPPGAAGPDAPAPG